MPMVRIGAKHQITIPKPVFEELSLEKGDYLEIVVKDGRGMFVPKKAQFVSKAPAKKLSLSEQKALEAARKKIQKINDDHIDSKGLTRKEAKVAAKVGIIDPDQMYWWLEDWQKGEREASKEIEAGETKSFDSAEAFLEDLRS